MEQCLTTSKGKTPEKNWGAQNWVRNWFFCHFLKLALLVFLDIAQDCSFLTSSRAAETSTKICGPNKGLTSPNRFQNEVIQKSIFFLTLLKEGSLIKLIFNIS